MNDSNLGKLQALQDRCFKICLGLRNTPTSQIVCSSALVAPPNGEQLVQLFNNKTDEELIHDQLLAGLGVDRDFINLETYCNKAAVSRALVNVIEYFTGANWKH